MRRWYIQALQIVNGLASMGAQEWMAIINVHIKWKQRLMAYIDSEGIFERLDARLVASDQKCVLGKWIDANSAQFENAEALEIVRLHHAEFHRKAGEVVLLVDDNRLQDASLLLNGSYTQVSEQLKRDIIKLSKGVSQFA
jgi:hypothetical protein